jgi:hypothetical protein
VLNQLLFISYLGNNQKKRKGDEMELCPKCGRVTAERNHYTKMLVCYNIKCCYQEGKENRETISTPRNTEKKNIKTNTSRGGKVSSFYILM